MNCEKSQPVYGKLVGRAPLQSRCDAIMRPFNDVDRADRQRLTTEALEFYSRILHRLGKDTYCSTSFFTLGAAKLY